MGQILLENSNARFIWVMGGENCPFWVKNGIFGRLKLQILMPFWPSK